MDARNGESASRCVVCDVPGQLWVVDISYIDSAEGWPLLVLALSVDLRINVSNNPVSNSPDRIFLY